MPMLLNKHRFALLVALATVSLPLAAQAQRKSPLADAPAIRKRFELRSTRSSWARAPAHDQPGLTSTRS
jgi:hypothetical protein